MAIPGLPGGPVCARSVLCRNGQRLLLVELNAVVFVHQLHCPVLYAVVTAALISPGTVDKGDYKHTQHELGTSQLMVVC